MTLALWLLAALALAWAGGWATRRALVAVSPTGQTRTVREMPLTAAFGILVIALYLLVALLAVGVELLLGRAEWLLSSPGLRQEVESRSTTGRRRRARLQSRPAN